MSDVVAEAEVANGTFYNYFADRDALFDALAEHLAINLAAQAALEINVEDAALRLTMTSARVLARAAQDPVWGGVIMRLETMRTDIRRNTARYLRDDLDDGFAQGRFAVGADAATVDLVGAMLAMSIRRICAGRADREYVVESLSLVLCALGIARDEASELAGEATDAVGVVFDATPAEIEAD